VDTAESLLARDERPWPSSEDLAERGSAFLAACDPPGLRAVVAEGAAWRSPEALWDALAACTPLGLLAGYARDPLRNRLPDGHVQSQAEHTLTLVEGLHALRTGDPSWFRTRAAVRLGHGSMGLLRRLARWLGAADEPVFRAVVLGGAFHDCGKLVGDLPGVDAENGAHLFARLAGAARLPAPYAGLGEAVVRFHDLVRHHACPGVRTFVAATAAGLPAAGPHAAAALAVVQVAGRASIGHRRLDAASLSAMADLMDRWPRVPPAPVGLTVTYGAGDRVSTTARPAGRNTVAHVVTVDEPAAPVTLLNGAPCRFAA
jgi:hypothetical protein